MAVYKVPQDVEADDKLIGPFSFRQFIYLIIVAAAGGIAFFLSQLFIPLAILPLPVIIFFGALALPLRKDQPMETYLAALVQFYLKPRRRLWNPDGTTNLVEITVPKVIEVQRTKDLSEDEAERRLSYLASIVDSRGWAVRGVQQQGAVGNGVMNTDYYYEAQAAPDMMDEQGGVGVAFDTRLDQADTQRHQQMLARVRQPQQQPTPLSIPDPYANLGNDAPAPSADDPNIHVAFNPYPTMNQSVVAPIDPNAPVWSTTQPAPAAQKAEDKGDKPISPDIINLANNSDLSVETIAREANRIHEKEKLDDEVVISLR